MDHKPVTRLNNDKKIMTKGHPKSKRPQMLKVELLRVNKGKAL